MAQSHAGDAGEEASSKKGPGVMTLVKAVAFVSVIVGLQVAAATVMLPSAEKTLQVGVELATAGHGEESSEPGTAEAQVVEQLPDTREVDLGSYHVVSYNPATGTSLNIDFALFGIVLAAEEEAFNALYAVHQKRLNEQVTIAIRGLETSDLTDPGLGLLKRMILEKTNRALGKSLVREAVFSEFSFIER